MKKLDEFFKEEKKEETPKQTEKPRQDSDPPKPPTATSCEVSQSGGEKTGYYKCHPCNFETYNWSEFRDHIHKEHIERFYKSIGLE